MPTAPAPRPLDRRATAGLALAVLLAALGSSAATVALPSLAETFGAPIAHAQWVVLAYLLAMTATAVLVGRLGDAIGRDRALRLGLLVFLAATLGCALAPTLPALIAARALQGVGAAVLVALPLALARDWAPAARLGAAMGLLGSASAVGTALGPAGGGILLGTLGWPALFAAMLPLGAAAALLLPRAAPRTPAAARREAGPGPRLAELLREPRFRGGAAMNLLVAAVMMSTLIVGPFALTAGLGLGPTATGLALAVGPIVAAATGLAAGRLVDRVGAPRAAGHGLATLAGGVALLAVLPGLIGLPGYLLAIAVLTPGYQLFLAANSVNALAAVPAAGRGAAAGTLGLSRNLGLLAGAGLMGWLYAAVAGASGDPLAAMRIVFAVATLLALGALAVSLVQRRGTAASPGTAS